MAEQTLYDLQKILRGLENRIDKAQCCCESLTGKNLGLGNKIFYSKNKNFLQFRTLIAGSNITITTDSNNETITINSLAGGGFSCSDLASCSTSNLPEGTNLYYTDARVLSYMTGQNISIFTNDSGYITSSALTPYLTISTAASTYEPIIAPGTTAQYWRGDKTWQTFPTIPTVGTWGALNYPTWVSGTPFVKMTAAGTFALDTNTYLTSAVTSVATSTGLTGGTITSTGTLSLNSKLAPLDTLTGNSLKLARVNSGETALEYFTPTYGTGSVTSVGTTGLISGGPITTTGTITTSMNTNKLVGRSTAGTGVMEEITIGTGLSLSAGTLSNSSPFTTPLTTKGDIYVRNAASDTRLPVGLDTQILLADSSTTTGLKWGTNTAATPLGYYGAFQDNTTQTATTINTPYAMRFGITDLSNGITIVSDGSNLTRITIANTGIYNIQFSAQFDRTNSGTDAVDIWLRKNGVDVPGSGGKIILTGGAAASAILASWNYVLDIVAGDYYQLMWSTPDTHVRLLYEAAQTTPFVHPIIPSTILTVTQQSGIMAGTGITAINSLTGAAQTMVAGTSGTDFAVSSVGTTHTLNLPTASATNRGALSTADWSTFNGKQAALGFTPEDVSNKTNTVVGNETSTTKYLSVKGYYDYLVGLVWLTAQLFGTWMFGLASKTTPVNADLIIISDSADSNKAKNVTLSNALNLAPNQIFSAPSATVALLTTSFFFLSGSTIGSTTESNRFMYMPKAGTFKNLYIYTVTSQPATGSCVITVRINGVDSALTLTIAAGSAPGVFSNLINSVTYAAGDRVTLKVVNNATLTASAQINSTSIQA